MSEEIMYTEVALARMVNNIPSGCSLQNSFGRWFYGPTEPGHEMFSGKTPTEALIAGGLRHDAPPTTCQNYLRNLGGAWPRSCPTCGLGPCKFGIVDTSEKPSERLTG